LQLVRETAAAYDASSGPAQISAAVLGFKSAGIDRVLFLVPNGLGPLFFVRAASAQDYHPKYGFSSFDEVAAQADLLPAKELEGSAGVGWRQLLDVGDTAPAHTASYRSCLSIMRWAGLRLDGLSAVFSALQACDGLLVLATALGPATGPLRSGVLRERIDALSSSYSSPSTLATRFAGDRHDAAAAVRDFRYDPGCGCFAYTGPPRAS
jgi:hypothetical protein